MGHQPVAGVAADEQAPAAIISKEEIIYAALSQNGSLRSGYAVNHFELDESGIITDYGNYSSVSNLTDTAVLTQTGDAVTLRAANKGNFYYQGNLRTAELPWIFEITYTLNDRKTPPSELVGKSGELEISISVKKNAAAKPVFYENYMLQISISLDAERCKRLYAPGATLAAAGSNKIAAYTLMPGEDAEISLSMSASDFAMDGIDIAAMPFSMDIEAPDTEGMTNGLTQLSDAVSDFSDGMGELAKGTAELKSGAGKHTDGSALTKEGLSNLSGGSGQLLQASAQIGSALTQIAGATEGVFGDGSADFTQLPQILTQLADGLDAAAGGLTVIRNAQASAYSALEGSMQAIPELTLSQAQITELHTNTDPAQHALLDQIIASQQAGQSARGVYNQIGSALDTAAAIDALSASIATISANIRGISAELTSALPQAGQMEQLTQLAGALSGLEKSYQEFHNGLNTYMGGVEKLATGYTDFHSGLSALGDGTAGLHDGAVKLHDGAESLSDETAKIPDRLQEEIDDSLNKYKGRDFTPESFCSPKNTSVELVQFVFKCEGIEQEEKEHVGEEAATETLWDRLVRLFLPVR
jgi:X-X-X-Leu-X-X-Gly heptad repeat protein